jgi:uncharacterized protein (TIGR02453 family)
LVLPVPFFIKLLLTQKKVKMLQAASVKFLKELKKNNNKPWFDSNRKKYEEAKADYLDFVEQLLATAAKFDDSIGNLKAKECIFRINRDVRFSKDKSPYKSNMGASLNKGGKKINTAGYYFHFEPGQSFAGGGFYMPEPADLAKLRQEIDYSFDEWKKIVNSKSFIKNFPEGVQGIDKLVRPPKGYDESNPAIEYLKMKGFIVSRPIADDDLTNKNLIKEITKTFEAMKPMIDFLNRAIE